MRRRKIEEVDAASKTQHVRGYLPLIFWRQCACCRDELRHEWMWASTFESASHHFRGRSGPSVYMPHPILKMADVFLCRKCAPTRADAEAFLLDVDIDWPNWKMGWSYVLVRGELVT